MKPLPSCLESDDIGWIKNALEGQGNRVKNLCCNETCEEVVVPGGDFAFETEAVLAGGLADQIVGDMPERSEGGGGVLGSSPTFVSAEGHVHDPVEGVLDRPMVAGDRAELMGEPHQ